METESRPSKADAPAGSALAPLVVFLCCIGAGFAVMQNVAAPSAQTAVDPATKSALQTDLLKLIVSETDNGPRFRVTTLTDDPVADELTLDALGYEFPDLKKLYTNQNGENAAAPIGN